MKKLPALNKMLLQILLNRLFIPLLFVWIIAIAEASHFVLEILIYQQQQEASSLNQMVDRHLDQGCRILDAIARVTENTPPENVTVFMESTWEAYKHFDTIYYLDETHRISLMVPSDQTYLGLDMSNLPDFQQIEGTNSITISRPFISLRTGEPTVYLIRQLSNGGCIVGELNLGTIQHDITDKRGKPGEDSIFILDHVGTVLVYPKSELVKQQTNIGYLELFRKGLDGDTTLIYDYNGKYFLGSATRIERVGWIIICQIPLFTLGSPYVITWGINIIIMLGIWLALVWNLRSQLEQNVVAPLVQLSQSTNALAIGDYSKISKPASMPTVFVELNRLTNDFQRMSTTLQARQAALQESEERYRSLFERVPIGLFRSTTEGKILDANQALIDILGFPDYNSLLGKNTISFYLNPQDREKWQALAKQRPLTFYEAKVRRYDDTIIWVRIRCRAVWKNESTILFYDGSIEDISQYKYAQEELRQARDELETRVQERTTALAEVNMSLRKEIMERKKFENQLKEKNEELETAYSELKNIQTQIIRQEKMASIGQLAVAVAHEIRNPMTTVRGFLQLMERRPEYLADKANLELMIEEIDRANAIIREYLFLSREKVAHLKNCSLNGIIQSLFPLIQATANNSKVYVSLDLAEIPELLLDENEIRQLLLNLIRNGIEAMPTGGELSIRTFNEAGRVALTISDQGCGIPASILDNLGTPFMTTKDTGTGLGLPMCYQIVNRHNGEIKVCTSPHGTVFSIYFNLAK